MKCKREMSAEQHLRMLEDRGEIKVKGMTVTAYTDEDGDVTQEVDNYMTYCARKGYKVVYREA